MLHFEKEDINVKLELVYKKKASNFKERMLFFFVNTAYVWKTLEDIEYTLTNGINITVKAGFEFDLISVPPFISNLIKEYDVSIKAYILHDYLYVNDYVFNNEKGEKMNDKENRAFIDKEMFRIATELNKDSYFIEKTRYLAVRMFGKKVYDRKKAY